MSPFSLRRWIGTRFVRRAPTKRGAHVDLQVSPLTPSSVLWWHAHVQPVIDDDPTRADRGWDWLRYEPFTRLAGGAAGRQPAGYAVGLVPARDSADPVFIPCALLLLVGRAPALDHPRRRSVFVGYLSTAPAAALTSIGKNPLGPRDIPRRLGAIALDVAITHSLNTGQGGRIVLHAAETGGEALLGWYTKQGMLVHPEGRHCYFNAQGALEASRRLDPLR